MAPVAIVTDSTAGIPADLVKEFAITVVPQDLIWDGKTYRDSVDISPHQFYDRLATSKSIPTSSQVPVVTMQQVFEDLLNKGFDVLGVFVSAKLSGTLQSAAQAKANLVKGADRVRIVDSCATSMAMGFQALAAAKAAQTGAGIDALEAMITASIPRIGVYFTVETLEFLHRGGRIGGATRFLGSALNMKPVLELKDGRVDASERVRTKAKAIDRMIELTEERLRGRKGIHIAAIHTNNASEAAEALERIKDRVSPQESFISDLSPVVGVHGGPGIVGMAFLADA